MDCRGPTPMCVLEQIRRAFGQAMEQSAEPEAAADAGFDGYRCPRCGIGRLMLVAFAPVPATLIRPQPPTEDGRAHVLSQYIFRRAHHRAGPPAQAPKPGPVPAHVPTNSLD